MVKYLNEFRNADLVQRLAREIKSVVTQPYTLMEICGGQTHAIVKYGIDQLLPETLTLIHGPGCPVCVTPIEIIDQAIALATLPHVILCSFGDMLRVPGTQTNLLTCKAEGADIRMVYSPLDCLKLAQQHPDQQVVFLGVGFETTAPATAMTIVQAAKQHLTNFSMLVSHVLVPPAMEAILSDPDCQIQGFLAAGHVCTVMGYQDYCPIAAHYNVPIVVTGFEPLDILQGIYHCVQQLAAGEANVDNHYTRSVRPDGNPQAKALIQDVFTVVTQRWRGLGWIPNSGLQLRDRYQAFDAQQQFAAQLPLPTPTRDSECMSGKILQGTLKPAQCPAFGTRCTPDHPLGAPMVSSEGACAAYYRYRQPTYA